MNAFEEGQQAKRDGKHHSENPYAPVGFTRLGASVLSDDGWEWRDGWGSVGRAASAKEVNDADHRDPSHFRKKRARSYG
jgi:hypothetical protein